ncbi:MAG: epoxyqueuosine reductase QueH [Candidatus Brocadiae bacterium]|nr:epoxyqueuosine reductase QueH [Candidatus Brocadiia bacterium]
MPNDALLVHTCCAPCLGGLLEPLRERDTMFTAFFHNPNIHPLIEFRRRLKAVHLMADGEKFPLVAHADYGLEAFLDAVGADRAAPARCRACYALRLEATARHAAAHGFAAFTSTLLVSPQQMRDVVCELGHAAATRHGVAFDDTDHRSRHRAGLDFARRHQLYRQKYCGCVFSEYDRYRNTTKHVYQPHAV